MTYNFIQTEIQDYIYILTLSRPAKRNAFTPTMVNEIAHAIQEANTLDAVKLLVLKAEGPVFCAGMDLKSFQNEEHDQANPHIRNQNISLGEVFLGLHKPSIALVEGDVIAGAFLMITACTYVYCRKQVRFRLPELNIGLFPFQVMAGLLQVMPEKKMLQLCLHTDYFSAAEAQAYGLIDGYLEEVDQAAIFAAFKDMSTTALRAGFKAARQLPHIAQEQRYTFLLESLAALKTTKDVQDKLFS